MSQQYRRSRTRDWLRQEGLEISSSLPFLEESLVLSRSAGEIADRAAILSVMALAAHHPHARGVLIQWLKHEALWDLLAPTETVFVESAKPSRSDVSSMSWCSEATFALCWVLGVAGIDGGALHACPDDLRWKLPDVSKGESMKAFREHSVSRGTDDLLDALDRIYCLHWRQTEDALQGLVRSYPLSPPAVVQRRWAFEWLFSRFDWNQVSLDT